MTSRRIHTTGELVRATSIELPTHSRTETPGVFKQLGIGGHSEEREREFDVIFPPRKRTQKEQDKEDEEARKRAMTNLVNSWQERLQLISVITTFFASIEAGMLVPVNTDPNAVDALPSLLKAANAGFLGALIMHVYAAVLSFLAAFLLIRYKLKEASNEELFAEGRAKGFQITASPVNGSFHVQDIERDAQNNDAQKFDPENSPQTGTSDNHADTKYAPPVLQRMGSQPAEPPIFVRDPHLEQVGFWSPTISSHLLSRVHALCIILAGVGFILAIMGIMTYAWALQPKEVSIFVTVCFGAAVLAMGVLLLPDP
ncbi:uncharacterized protein BJ212DRAFT_1475650 [Suillus subaureus]|uniref:Uncharacterized protein n=1 Tax=Suillus subaureus TaxID=48587 RepID=A0A9P7EKI5_9AGAM|nr:uncharacterized protein BJ212DRAFT_1475650 [Suillus subaureus]KAG1824344.1 hypothetical protein BJ212DRAFT_1475650 [Suillus subaureus]